MPEQAERSDFATTTPRVRVVGVDRPWAWLALGWEDMRRSARVGLVWSLVFVAIGAVLMGGLATLRLYEVMLPLAAGFPLIAPILVAGLYEVSRRLERGESVGLATPLAAWTRNASQIGFLGFVLGFVFLVWMRVATLIFAWFFGTQSFTFAGFVGEVVLSGTNILFLVVGTAVGAVLAAVVFASSVVSVPMLLDRETNVVTAIATSWAAVRANPAAMTLWAALIVLFTAAGFALALVGLVLTLPLIAHATWHAYRETVVFETD